MRKARLHLTLDIPLADDKYYPRCDTDEERARAEYQLLLDAPGFYLETVLRWGPGWISETSYRFVDEEIPGDDRIE